jgi:hypothetical protein
MRRTNVKSDGVISQMDISMLVVVVVVAVVLIVMGW